MDSSDARRIEDLIAQIEQLDAEVARYHRQIERERSNHLAALDEQRRRADINADAIRLAHAERLERLRLTHHGELTELRLQGEADVLAAQTAAQAQIDDIQRQVRLAVSGETARLEQAIAEAAERREQAQQELGRRRTQLDRERARMRTEVETARRERDELALRIAELETVRQEPPGPSPRELQLQADLEAALIANDELRAAHAAAVETREVGATEAAADLRRVEKAAADAAETAASTVERLEADLRAEQRRAQALNRRIERGQAATADLRSEIDALKNRIAADADQLSLALERERAGWSQRLADQQADHDHLLETERRRVDLAIADLARRSELTADEADRARAEAATERASAIASLETARNERDRLSTSLAAAQTERSSLASQVEGLRSELELAKRERQVEAAESRAAMAEQEQRHAAELADFELVLQHTDQLVVDVEAAHEQTVVALREQLESSAAALAAGRRTRSELERSLEEQAGRIRMLEQQLESDRMGTQELIDEIRAEAAGELAELELTHESRLEAERRRRADEVARAVARTADLAQQPGHDDEADRVRITTGARLESLTDALTVANREITRLTAARDSLERERASLRERISNQPRSNPDEIRQLTRRLDHAQSRLERERATAGAERQRLVEENLRLARVVDEIRVQALERLARANDSMAALRQSLGEQIREVADEAAARTRAAADREAELEAAIDQLRGN